MELEDAKGRGRDLARLFPWTDLVRRAATALELREPGAVGLPPLDDAEGNDEGHGRCLHILELVEPAIRGIAESRETFLEQCPAREEPIAAMVPPDWAGALLEQQSDLRDTRFRLVPGRLKEEEFWTRYFGTVFDLLTEEIRTSARECAGG